MSGIILGLVAALADVAPEPIRASGGGQWGVVMAGLFVSAAIIILGVMFVRRRGRK